MNVPIAQTEDAGCDNVVSYDGPVNSRVGDLQAADLKAGVIRRDDEIVRLTVAIAGASCGYLPAVDANGTDIAVAKIVGAWLCKLSRVPTHDTACVTNLDAVQQFCCTVKPQSKAATVDAVVIHEHVSDPSPFDKIGHVRRIRITRSCSISIVGVEG